MSTQQFSAKTVEEALKEAQDALGFMPTYRDYIVVEAPSKGFLGFGSKNAVIEVKVPMVDPETPVVEEKAPEVVSPVVEEAAAPDEIVEDPVDEEIPSVDTLVVEFLAPIFEAFQINPVVQIQEDDKSIQIDISGKRVGAIIGHHGDMLNALQQLLSVYLNRKINMHKRILVDVEGYRGRRNQTLEELAARMADKCRRNGRRVTLEPMTPAERRIIHLALEHEPGITTFSEGEDPYRYLVIMPKRDDV